MSTRLALPALILVAALFSGALAAGAAWACSCIGYRSAEAQLAETPLMFVGRAVRTAPEGAVPEPSPGSASRIAGGVTRFEVQRTLKGRAQPVRRIAHPTGDEASCGVTFKPGQSYVILSRASEGRLTTSWCDQPRFVMADYERALRPGR